MSAHHDPPRAAGDALHPLGYCPRCASPLVEARGDGGQPGCPACQFVNYANPKLAAGVVVARDGGLLLVRRNHEPMYGRWSFPSGFVDAGEVVEAAAAREVLEETGVTARVDHLLGVYSTPGHPVVFVAYAGTAVAGTPTVSPETMDVRVFELDALPQLAFPHDASIMAAWHALRND